MTCKHVSFIYFFTDHFQNLDMVNVTGQTNANYIHFDNIIKKCFFRIILNTFLNSFICAKAIFTKEIDVKQYFNLKCLSMNVTCLSSYVISD